MVSSSERVTAFDMVDVQLVDSKTNKKVMKNYLKLFFWHFYMIYLPNDFIPVDISTDLYTCCIVVVVVVAFLESTGQQMTQYIYMYESSCTTGSNHFLYRSFGSI